MADSREIVLAGNSYKITVPLTLGQLIACNVGMAVDVPDGASAVEASFERALHVISAAAKPENPELTVDFLRNLRGASMKELNEATTAIYEECGLIPRAAKDTPKGEDQAAA